MLLAGRLNLPEGIRALLFDLDGVLVDSLSLDDDIVAKLLSVELGRSVDVPPSVIRQNFALALPDFWRKISETLHLDLSSEAVARLTEAHESVRCELSMPVHEGIVEILDAARMHGVAV